MDNKYVRGLILVVVGFAILGGLLWVGELVAGATGGGDDFGLAEQGALGAGGWLTWLIIGAVVMYVIYVFFAEADLFEVGTREVVMMGIGAALYGVLSWVFNTVPVPSVSLVSLRPTVAIPIFFGFAFGPAVGFFVGAFGNVLGDALTGWGVFPVWDIGNGLMGLVPGLAGLYLGKSRGNRQMLYWIGVGVLALALIFVLVSPNVVDPWTGEAGDYSGWLPIVAVVVAVTLLLGLAPNFWPYVFILLTLAFAAFGVVDLTQNGFSGGVIVIWVAAVIFAALAFYVNTKTEEISKWLADEDTTTLVTFGTLGVVVGILFASMADIFINGYSFGTAFVGEFIPAAIPNTLFAIILTPLLFAAWKQARSQAGR